ncbi:MAG: Fe-S protein assembly chaperone HscA, partial [Myxococcales bacterium]
MPPALFEIAEPGQSRIKEACVAAAVGIDLGTTNSLVAVVAPDPQSGAGKPRALPVDEGSTLLPSVVSYQKGSAPIVGREARRRAADAPRDTIASVKRFMGRSSADPETKRLSPYRFAEGESGTVRFEVAGRTVTPVEVSADILRALKARAEEQLGMPVQKAVITVPAYFDDAQRQATKEAGRLAGLEVLRLLNEPTAAALAYGLDKRSEGTFAVYDLGGGTFDISILKLEDGVFEVKATGGDSALGGDDFDQRLFCHITQQAGVAPLSDEDTATLMVKARQAKELLSTTAETTVEAILNSGEIVQVTVSAKTFAEITQPLVAKTMNAVRKAMRDADVSVEDVDGVVLVGGATRMPNIRRAVGDFFKTIPHANIDPDKVVALGAAIQANLLAGNRAAGDDWLLLDVIPLSLGIETMGGLVEKIIPRNSTIPCARAQEVTTFKDGQTALAVHVVQGERELVSDCRSLARFELRGIPPMAAGAARIRVTYQVDADGLLSVSARETRSGVESSITVKPSYGLGDDEVARMLQDSYNSAQGDMVARALREEQVEAERILLATQSALDTDAELLSDEERAAVALLEQGVRDALARSNDEAVNVDERQNKLHDAVQQLAHGTEEF